MNDKINWVESLKKYLPQKIIMALEKVDDETVRRIEEIRLRVSQPLMIYTCERGFQVTKDGCICDQNGICVDEADIERTFSAITGKSAYAFQDEIRQGFITLENGIRTGIAGSAKLTDGNIRVFNNISSINFRIPHEAIGIAEKLMPYIAKQGRLSNTLIISAPKLGKTTLARDIARCAGSGIGLPSCKVSIIDERQELAAGQNGEPLFDVGTETDVISNVLKHTGVFMALRALSPDVIVTDEIGRSEDLEALREVANSGVTMITTAHASNINSLMNRLFFRKIFDEQLFDSYIVLSSTLGRITVEQIYNSIGDKQIQEPIRLMPKEAI